MRCSPSTSTTPCAKRWPTSASICRRWPNASPMRRSATVASVAWPLVSWTRWRPSACPAWATGFAMSTACSASASSTASRSRRPTTGSRAAIHGNSSGPKSTTACASVAMYKSVRATTRPTALPTGSTRTTCWPWPTTPSFRATARRRPTRCVCGRHAPPKRSTFLPSTRATTWSRSRARTSRKTFRACSTRMTQRHRAVSCDCIRSTFSAAPACRIYCAAICATTPPSIIWVTRSAST